MAFILQEAILQPISPIMPSSPFGSFEEKVLNGQRTETSGVATAGQRFVSTRCLTRALDNASPSFGDYTSRTNVHSCPRTVQCVSSVTLVANIPTD